jgi:hypothetical protein
MITMGGRLRHKNRDMHSSSQHTSHTYCSSATAVTLLLLLLCWLKMPLRNIVCC